MNTGSPAVLSITENYVSTGYDELIYWIVIQMVCKMMIGKLDFVQIYSRLARNRSP